MADLTVTSEQFTEGQPIPRSAAHQLAGGENLSPQLSWAGAPAGTRSYAITCYDPDAPTDIGFVHWVLFDLPASVTSLPQGAGGNPPAGSVEGYTDFCASGYGGMAPPPGLPHHYTFTVWALDVEATGLDSSATYAFFRFNTGSHVLAKGSLMGTFQAG